MKVGDLVRCTFQPESSRYKEGRGFLPMHHTIKGQIGVVREIHDRDGIRYIVMFPGCGGYRHTLAHSVLERLG